MKNKKPVETAVPLARVMEFKLEEEKLLNIYNKSVQACVTIGEEKEFLNFIIVTIYICSKMYTLCKSEHVNEFKKIINDLDYKIISLYFKVKNPDYDPTELKKEITLHIKKLKKFLQTKAMK